MQERDEDERRMNSERGREREREGGRSDTEKGLRGRESNFSVVFPTTRPPNINFRPPKQYSINGGAGAESRRSIDG